MDWNNDANQPRQGINAQIQIVRGNSRSDEVRFPRKKTTQKILLYLNIPSNIRQPPSSSPNKTFQKRSQNYTRENPHRLQKHGKFEESNDCTVVQLKINQLQGQLMKGKQIKFQLMKQINNTLVQLMKAKPEAKQNDLEFQNLLKRYRKYNQKFQEDQKNAKEQKYRLKNLRNSLSIIINKTKINQEITQKDLKFAQKISQTQNELDQIKQMLKTKQQDIKNMQDEYFKSFDQSVDQYETIKQLQDSYKQSQQRTIKLLKEIKDTKLKQAIKQDFHNTNKLKQQEALLESLKSHQKGLQEKKLNLLNFLLLKQSENGQKFIFSKLCHQRQILREKVKNIAYSLSFLKKQQMNKLGLSPQQQERI